MTDKPWVTQGFRVLANTFELCLNSLSNTEKYHKQIFCWAGGSEQSDLHFDYSLLKKTALLPGRCLSTLGLPAESRVFSGTKRETARCSFLITVWSKERRDQCVRLLLSCGVTWSRAIAFCGAVMAFMSAQITQQKQTSWLAGVMGIKKNPNN